MTTMSNYYLRGWINDVLYQCLIDYKNEDYLDDMFYGDATASPDELKKYIDDWKREEGPFDGPWNEIIDDALYNVDWDYLYTELKEVYDAREQTS